MPTSQLQMTREIAEARDRLIGVGERLTGLCSAAQAMLWPRPLQPAPVTPDEITHLLASRGDQELLNLTAKTADAVNQSHPVARIRLLSPRPKKEAAGEWEARAVEEAEAARWDGWPNPLWYVAPVVTDAGADEVTGTDALLRAEPVFKARAILTGAQCAAAKALDAVTREIALARARTTLRRVTLVEAATRDDEEEDTTGDERAHTALRANAEFRTEAKPWITRRFEARGDLRRMMASTIARIHAVADGGEWQIVLGNHSAGSRPNSAPDGLTEWLERCVGESESGSPESLRSEVALKVEELLTSGATSHALALELAGNLAEHSLQAASELDRIQAKHFDRLHRDEHQPVEVPWHVKADNWVKLRKEVASAVGMLFDTLIKEPKRLRRPRQRRMNPLSLVMVAARYPLQILTPLSLIAGVFFVGGALSAGGLRQELGQALKDWGLLLIPLSFCAVTFVAYRDASAERDAVMEEVQRFLFVEIERACKDLDDRFDNHVEATLADIEKHIEAEEVPWREDAARKRKQAKRAEKADQRIKRKKRNDVWKSRQDDLLDSQKLRLDALLQLEKALSGALGAAEEAVARSQQDLVRLSRPRG